MTLHILELKSDKTVIRSSLHELEISSLENLKESLEKKFECTLEDYGEDEKIYKFYNPITRAIYSIYVEE